MKKIVKGTFEYYNNMQIRQIIQTIIFFFVPLSLFAAGYIATGTKKNLLTIVAVLGLLPACKSAVEMIMYLKYHGCNDDLKQFVEDKVTDLTHSYSMVFTTPDTGTYEIPSIVVHNNCICGICLNKKAKPELLEKHITAIMKQNGYGKVVVKIFDSQEAYAVRLKQMKESASDNKKLDAEQMHLLHNISL